MSEAQLVQAQREAAEEFVISNLDDLCRELVAFDDSGLFGAGKAHELRVMCGFAGPSAQALATGMIEIAAVRAVASRAPADRRERVARAICAACHESPDHVGDARGNAFRWHDYLDAADAAIANY